MPIVIGASTFLPPAYENSPEFILSTPIELSVTDVRRELRQCLLLTHPNMSFLLSTTIILTTARLWFVRAPIGQFSSCELGLFTSVKLQGDVVMHVAMIDIGSSHLYY
jgi:hypothetical protein